MTSYFNLLPFLATTYSLAQRDLLKASFPFLLLETGFHVAQAGLELWILLSPLPVLGLEAMSHFKT